MKRVTAMVVVMLAATASAAVDVTTAARASWREGEGEKTQWAPTRNFSALNARAVLASESRSAARPYAGEGGATAAGSGEARYYDSKLGLFLSRDEFEGVLTEAPSLHRFAYAHNRPLVFVDPEGREVFPPGYNPFARIEFETMRLFQSGGIGGTPSGTGDGTFGNQFGARPPQGGLSGFVGGLIRAVSLRTVPMERNASALNQQMLDQGAAQAPIVDAAARLLTGVTASGARADRRRALLELALEVFPVALAVKAEVKTIRSQVASSAVDGIDDFARETKRLEQRSVKVGGEDLVSGEGRVVRNDDAAQIMVGENEGMALQSGAQNDRQVSVSQVTKNKEVGDRVRDAIARREGSGTVAADTEVNIKTVGGVRRVDVLVRPPLAPQVKAIESKVGPTSLGARERQELARDWWSMRQGQVDEVQWEFSPNAQGEVGPSRPLQQKLDKLGFKTKTNEEQPK